MRNLKRALSLALAAIMLIGMMVVSASAAGFDDFSDKDEIVNKDAVSMLTTLGVINGKEDGSYFDPTGNGLKDVQSGIQAAGEPMRVSPDMDALLAAFAAQDIRP